MALAPEQQERLIAAALAARERAYAPYSRFQVGAAVLTSAGEVVAGCNVENASFGLTNCAERVAIGKAVSEGAHEFAAIAVTGPEDALPCTPCGACRQVLYEFGPDLCLVTSAQGGEGYQLTTVSDLLPGAFGPARLAASRGGR